MPGSIRRKQPGRWELRISQGFDPGTGRRRMRSKTITAANEGQARLALTRWERELARDPGDAHTFAELLEAYYARTESRRTERSNENVRRQIDRLTRLLGPRRVRTMTVEDIEDAYATLLADLRPSTVRSTHAVVSGAFALARRWGWAERSIADDVEFDAGPRSEVDLVDAADVRRLLLGAEAKSPEFGLFVRLAAVTGARCAEISALRWEDIGWFDPAGAGTITIRRSLTKPKSGLAIKTTKTGKSRTVDVDFATLQALEKVRALNVSRGAGDGPGRWVFCDLSRDAVGALPYHPNLWSCRFYWLRKNLGINCRLHDLRHWATSELLASMELDPKEVQARGGWSNASQMLDTYAHLILKQSKAAGILAARLEPRDDPSQPDGP